MQNLASGGHSRYGRGRGKLPHNQQVNGPIESLQHQGSHDGQSKFHKRPHNGAGCKVCFLVHSKISFLRKTDK